MCKLHDTDSPYCWCQPELRQVCPELPESNVCPATCWRCHGRGDVEPYDDALETLVVHRDMDSGPLNSGGRSGECGERAARVAKRVLFEAVQAGREALASFRERAILATCVLCAEGNPVKHEIPWPNGSLSWFHINGAGYINFCDAEGIRDLDLEG